jgi:hypothetical protein
MHPELLAPVLQIIHHRVIATFPIKQTGVKLSEAATGAVTFIRRFGSAFNLNIHLHGLVLDGSYCISTEGAPHPYSIKHRPPPASNYRRCSATSLRASCGCRPARGILSKKRV